jgi:hypothetical protein
MTVACRDVEAATLARDGSPPITRTTFSDVPCPLPRRIERVRVSIASPLTRPSPNGRRVGIRIVTFEACSGFTHVTARRIAQPPKATFVTRLQPFRLPGRAARQLPDQSTTLRVESSSTGDPRLRGALPQSDTIGPVPWSLAARGLMPVRTAGAVHMTAGYNALRESGPGQNPAFDNAMAQVGYSRRLARSPSGLRPNLPQRGMTLVHQAKLAADVR